MIVTVIREAETEQEVIFYLTSYVESLQFGDQLNLLPDSMKALPLTGTDNVQERFQQLIIELDRASKRLDHKACGVIKEALHTFGTAVTCLEALNSKQNSQPSRRMLLRRKTDFPYLSPDLAIRPDAFDAGRVARIE